MKRPNGSSVGARDEVTSKAESIAGILGQPPRLPDPNMSWDELVEGAAAAEYLANEQRSTGGAVEDDD